jgi:hypothetical protein
MNRIHGFFKQAFNVSKDFTMEEEMFQLADHPPLLGLDLCISYT